MKRTRNLLIIVAVLVAVVAVSALTAKHADPIAVKTIAVKPGSFQTKLPENGVVQRPRIVTVPTLVAGNLQTISVKPGDYVQGGQTLATIENPSLQSNAASSQADYDSAAANIRTAQINEQNAKVTYEAQVETSKADLAEAQRVYEADVALYNSRAIPRNQLDADKTKLEQVRTQYEQAVRQLRLGAVTGYGQDSVQYAQATAQKMRIVNASNQQQLGFTRIEAPFDGVIQTIASEPDDALRSVRPGDPVTQGQALFTIAQSDAYIVKAEVDEQDIINVRVGQQANVTGEDFPGQTLTGRVTAISPVAIKSTDPSSTARQVLTTIRLDRSPSFLRDGMSVDVDILTANLANAILVPASAIQKDGKKSYVYVVRAGKATKRSVTTGANNGMQTVIKSGLVRGDVVITDKNPLIHDGSLVAPAPAVSPTPAS